MKIKIKKSNKLIRERYGLSPSSILPTEEMFKNIGLIQQQLELLNNLKEQAESLFNKDLLFYDLETTGLRRKEGDNQEIADMIHQIAILKYSPNGDPDSISAETPNDFYVAKAEVPPEYSQRSLQLKTTRASILGQTNPEEYTAYKDQYLQNDSFEKEPREMGSDPSDEAVKNVRDDVKETMGLFLHILINYPVKSFAKKTLRTKRDESGSFYLYPKISEYIDTLENSDEIEEIIDNGNPSREQLIQLYNSVFSEDSVRGGVSTYLQRLGQTKYKNRIEKLINLINTTIEENKVFTMYDNFPLEKYHKKNSLDQQYTAPVNEKEALQGMMDYIDKQGNPSPDNQLRGDYVLVGQNIISFDNPFVIARCNYYGITNTQNFRNSYVYDTRYLFSTMIKYFQTLGYFYGLVETAHLIIRNLMSYQQRDPDQQQAYQKAIQQFQDIKVLRDYKNIGIPAKEVRQILEKLKKAGKAKGKLETLMKAFIKDAPKQTHTADDDCEKLAAVFIPAMKKFYQIYAKTFEFVKQLDSKNVTAIYRIVKNSPIDPETKQKTKTIPSQIGKTKTAIGFQKTKGVGDIIKKVAKKFAEDLSFEYLRNPPPELTGVSKEEIEKLIIRYFKAVEGLKGQKPAAEKINTYKKYMNFTEQETINWTNQKLIPALPQLQGDTTTTVTENKKTIKLKIILKERKNGKT